MKLPNASKQILLSMLRNEINFEQEHLEYTKTETKYFYDLSDKNNPNLICVCPAILVCYFLYTFALVMVFVISIFR